MRDESPRPHSRVGAGWLLLLAALGAALMVIAQPVRREQKLDAAINRGLDFILKAQDTDGGFDSFWVPPGAKADESRRTRAIFHNAWITLTLQRFAVIPPVAMAHEQGQRFLRIHRLPSGLFRYFVDEPPVISPDVDDTALAWLAIGPGDVRDRDAEARMWRALDEARRPDGTYATWLTGGAPLVGTDTTIVDPVVQANVLALLAAAGRVDPELCLWLLARADRPAQTVYYPGPGAWPLALSRAYEAGAACLEPGRAGWETLARAVLFEPEVSVIDAASAVRTLLATCTLPIPAPVQDAVQGLVDWQKRDGGWPMAVHVWSPVAKVGFGSRAQTTAIVLDALGAWQRCRDEGTH